MSCKKSSLFDYCTLIAIDFYLACIPNEKVKKPDESYGKNEMA